jgi:glycine cleavage system H protein
VYVEIETEGETLGQDEVFGSVEAVKTVSDLYLPMAGEVVEVNGQLDKTPEVVNEDPYGKGWMIKVSASDVSQWDSLMSADEYKSLLGA